MFRLARVLFLFFPALSWPGIFIFCFLAFALFYPGISFIYWFSVFPDSFLSRFILARDFFICFLSFPPSIQRFYLFSRQKAKRKQSRRLVAAAAAAAAAAATAAKSARRHRVAVGAIDIHRRKFCAPHNA